MGSSGNKKRSRSKEPSANSRNKLLKRNSNTGVAVHRRRHDAVVAVRELMQMTKPDLLEEKQRVNAQIKKIKEDNKKAGPKFNKLKLDNLVIKKEDIKMALLGKDHPAHVNLYLNAIRDTRPDEKKAHSHNVKAAEDINERDRNNFSSMGLQKARNTPLSKLVQSYMKAKRLIAKYTKKNEKQKLRDAVSSYNIHKYAIYHKFATAGIENVNVLDKHSDHGEVGLAGVNVFITPLFALSVEDANSKVESKFKRFDRRSRSEVSLYSHEDSKSSRSHTSSEMDIDDTKDKSPKLGRKRTPSEMRELLKGASYVLNTNSPRVIRFLEDAEKIFKANRPSSMKEFASGLSESASLDREAKVSNPGFYKEPSSESSAWIASSKKDAESYKDMSDNLFSSVSKSASFIPKQRNHTSEPVRRRRSSGKRKTNRTKKTRRTKKARSLPLEFNSNNSSFVSASSSQTLPFLKELKQKAAREKIGMSKSASGSVYNPDDYKRSRSSLASGSSYKSSSEKRRIARIRELSRKLAIQNKSSSNKPPIRLRLKFLKKSK